LSDETLCNLPIAGADFHVQTGSSLLAPILIPRVPGTPAAATVQQHFVNFFSSQLPEWSIEFQNFSAQNPATANIPVPFVNIILTRDPPWARPGHVGRLTIAAHYDSKLTPLGFIGATDSAASCAMLMHVARSVDEALTSKWAAMEAEGSRGREGEKGIHILLLDGEEAFVRWSDYDAFYGSRYVPLPLRECEYTCLYLQSIGGKMGSNAKSPHVHLPYGHQLHYPLRPPRSPRRREATRPLVL
jgi:hypothetical protein